MNNLQVKTAYVGSTQIKQVRKGGRLVLAPNGNKLWYDSNEIPSLDLRFAENKSLVDATTGSNLVTFTRASSGTFTGSDGLIQSASTDVPRFNHNPTTGESLGLLVEEQRVNLALQSEDFSTTWTTTRASVSTNAIAAPNGTTTAGKLVEDNTATNTHFVQQSASVTSGTSYTSSIYVKAAERNFVQLVLNGRFASIVSAIFDLSTGAVGTTTGTPTTSATQLANGWWRFSVTQTANATGSTFVQVRVADSSTTATYTGDGASGIYIWGAQLEAGAFPTSYIPTATATVTRSADVASDTTRGGNIRSLFTQFRSPASGTRPVVSLDDNTANERIEILTSGTDLKLLVTDGGSAVADLDAGTVSANTTARIAARFQTDDYGVSIDGATSQLDAVGTLPTATRIRIGSNQAGGYLNGTIARITGWESALPLLPPVSG